MGFKDESILFSKNGSGLYGVESTLKQNKKTRVIY